MTEIIFEVREAEEGGYTARALGEGIFTEADSIEELKEMIREAIKAHFDPGEEPKFVRLIKIAEEVFAA